MIIFDHGQAALLLPDKSLEKPDPILERGKVAAHSLVSSSMAWRETGWLANSFGTRRLADVSGNS